MASLPRSLLLLLLLPLLLLSPFCHVSASAQELDPVSKEKVQHERAEAAKASDLKQVAEGDIGTAAVVNSGVLRRALLQRKAKKALPRAAVSNAYKKCLKRQTPALKAGFANEILSALANKGYTTAARAFNMTGVLLGIRFRSDLLVPSNAAFQKLPAAVTKLLEQDERYVLQRLMRHHMLHTARAYAKLRFKKTFATYLHTRVLASSKKLSTGVRVLSFKSIDGYGNTSARIDKPELFVNCFGHHQGVDEVLLPSFEILVPPVRVPLAPAPGPSLAVSEFEARSALETGPVFNGDQWREIIDKGAR